ncbi:MAG: SAM-dependent DNA methyltransferase, partial [Phycisphaerales bacterium]|nr:SAM-dependent DNA methyltransferase [Phycisphaerales bacterium]
MMKMIAQHDIPKETQRQAVQARIDLRKSPAERNRLGQFATPNALAIDIARFVGSLIGKRKGGIRFADPAIGSGSFFSAALAVYGHKRMESAVGVELDPAFAEAARDLWADAGLDVVRGDFTRVVANGSCRPAPNLILANPPYVRHHHMGREDKERLQRLAFEMTGVEVNGLAGLYVYFLLLATAWMENDGYAAWLIPSEFMDVNYGAALKHFLTDRVTLIRAHRFDPDEVQFGDALVSSVVVVFRKAPPPPGHAPEFTFGGTLADPHASDRIPLDRLRESRKWTIYPSHAKNDRHTLSDGNGPTLSDFFRIQRGIATGDNKFFVLERADAKRRGLPAKYLRPILPSPRFLKATVIDGDDDGYPVISHQLCVIDCDLPEHLVEQRHPALWK